MDDNAAKQIEIIDAMLKKGISSSYEQMAINAVKRSWELGDPICQALALQDAQVWATLHLARTQRDLANWR